jgi:hypothetical protein
MPMVAGRGATAMPNPPAQRRQENGLPAEGLKLLRLFLSIEKKADRDRVFQTVEKFIERLKEQQ